MNDTASRTQRWRDRRTRFVPSATTINPADYAVDVITSEKIVSAFLADHHYLGTLPAARLSCGLYRKSRGGQSELAGVAVFTQPVNNASISLRTGLADPASACDLGRLVLLDDVPGNGETWFVARAMKLLRAAKPAIEAVIAYSDPVRQVLPDGKVVLPGHVGHLYGALSAAYTGRTQARRRLLMPNGSILSDRTISKIVSGDHGSGPAIERLLQAGAPAARAGEGPRDWLKRLESEGFVTKHHHPGCHAYTFPLARRAKAAIRTIAQPTRPTRDPNTREGDVTALPLFA